MEQVRHPAHRIAQRRSTSRKETIMLVLNKKLRVSGIRGADLNSTDAWAIDLKDRRMEIRGYEHSKDSTIMVDDEVAARMKLPPLATLANTTVDVTLRARILEGAATDRDWMTPLLSAWRADAKTRQVMFLTGLERHEYVEYTDDTAIFGLMVDKQKVQIAYFSSCVPTGCLGAPMGTADDPQYPFYYFALAVADHEYDELSKYLERSVAFDVEIRADVA